MDHGHPLQSTLQLPIPQRRCSLALCLLPLAVLSPASGDCYLAYHLPSLIPSLIMIEKLHILHYLIFIPTAGDGHFYPHFADKETEVHNRIEWNELPKDMPVAGRSQDLNSRFPEFYAVVPAPLSQPSCPFFPDPQGSTPDLCPIIFLQGKLGLPGLPGYPGRPGPKVRS